jgi:hypothetical protein
MTTWQSPERKSLDLARGIKLARWAYVSRMQKEQPAIKQAQFENSDGTVIELFDAKRLVEISERTP